MHVRFTKNGLTREVKAGFSWTVLFFGAFPFLFRGQWGWFILSAILGFATFGLSMLVMPFFANRLTARWLAERGWQVTDPAAKRWGINPSLVAI